MSVSVRKGNRSDLKAVLALVQELATFEKAPAEVEVTLQEMEAWGFGPDKQFHFFVLEQSGRIHGAAIYYYKYSTWKGKCLFLEDIVVTENERGKGYGTRLFNEVLKVAKEDKVRRMEWQVLDWNTPALKFYQKYNTRLDPEWINCKLTFEQIQSSV